MKLTIYDINFEVVGTPSLAVPTSANNVFIHRLMRSSDPPKHRAQAEMLAHFNLRWLESDNHFAFFEYSDEDLRQYIHYAAQEHADSVTYHWLSQMMERILKQWPFQHYTDHYVNSAQEMKTEPHSFFRLHRHYERSFEKKEQEESIHSHRRITEKHFNDWIDHAFINAADQPGFLVKLRMDDRSMWGQVHARLKLYNQHRAPLFKTPQLEVFTIFNPEDPYHMYYHTGHKP